MATVLSRSLSRSLARRSTFIPRHTTPLLGLTRQEIPKPWNEPSCQRLYSTAEATKAPAVSESPRPKGVATKRGSWNPWVDEQIVQLRAAQKTWEYIGLVVKRSPSAVSDRFYTALDPALRAWTPAMVSRLNQMVEDGTNWREIAASLNSTILTCQQQWRTIGKGKYRVKGLLPSATTVVWAPQEMNTYWQSWIKHGGQDWKRIALDMGNRCAAECRANLKPLVLAALKDAPGWVKLEVHRYMAEVDRVARARVQQVLNQKVNDVLAHGLKPSLGQSTGRWTPQEHKELLLAVEKYGLFTGWDNIRRQVKPEADEDEIEAEYYRLNGVQPDATTLSWKDLTIEPKKPKPEWTKEEIDRLKLMLTKYSHLPVWTELAFQGNIEPSDADYEDLFQKYHDEHATKAPKTRQHSGHKADAEDEAGSPDDHWTRDQLTRLRTLVGQQQQQEQGTGEPMDWSWIAEHVGPGFTPNMCITKWQTMPITSSIRVPAAKYWDEKDIDQLEKGLLAHGRSWMLIRKNFLPDRSTDSIRRKVSNLYQQRDTLVKSRTKKAIEDFEGSVEPVNVHKYVRDSLKDDPVMVTIERMEEILKNHRLNKTALKAKNKIAKT